MFNGKHIIIGTSAMVVTAAIVLLNASANGATPPVPVLAIPPSQLAAGGIQLDAPSSAQLSAAKIDQGTAVTIALNAVQGAKVIETHLSYVTDHFTDPEWHCLCWVVSVDPTNMVFNGPHRAAGLPPKPMKAAYSLILVDATTGRAVAQRTGGDPNQ